MPGVPPPFLLNTALVQWMAEGVCAWGGCGVRTEEAKRQLVLMRGAWLAFEVAYVSQMGRIRRSEELDQLQLAAVLFHDALVWG